MRSGSGVKIKVIESENLDLETFKGCWEDNEGF